MRREVIKQSAFLREFLQSDIKVSLFPDNTWVLVMDLKPVTNDCRETGRWTTEEVLAVLKGIEAVGMRRIVGAA